MTSIAIKYTYFGRTYVVETFQLSMKNRRVNFRSIANTKNGFSFPWKTLPHTHTRDPNENVNKRRNWSNRGTHLSNLEIIYDTNTPPHYTYVQNRSTKKYRRCNVMIAFITNSIGLLHDKNPTTEKKNSQDALRTLKTPRLFKSYQCFFDLSSLFYLSVYITGEN